MRRTYIDNNKGYVKVKTYDSRATLRDIYQLLIWHSREE